jgi:hypothetical protein
MHAFKRQISSSLSLKGHNGVYAESLHSLAFDHVRQDLSAEEAILLDANGLTRVR